MHGLVSLHGLGQGSFRVNRRSQGLECHRDSVSHMFQLSLRKLELWLQTVPSSHLPISTLERKDSFLQLNNPRKDSN